MEQERVQELCEGYAPLAKIVAVVGRYDSGHPEREIGEFLIQLVSDLQEAGALPARPVQVEVPDVSVVQRQFAAAPLD